MRPNDILLASYGRHTKIPGERGGKQPARRGCYRIDDSTVVRHPFKQILLCPGRNELLSFTLTVDLLKGSRPTTNLHGVRQRCTRTSGTSKPRCTSLQKRRDALYLSNQHVVQSEVVSHVPTFSTTQKRRQDRSSTYLGLVLFDRDGSDSGRRQKQTTLLYKVGR